MAAAFPSGVVPNPEALAISNLVPGAEMLGYGFDIFGTYSFDKAIKPLLKLGTPSSWQAPSGVVYALPANVTSPGGSSATATAETFATSDAFNKYFQGSASVSGSVAAFSGSFSSSYATDLQSQSSYSWALFEADYIAWHVGIEYAPQILLPNVTGDPDWSGLPSTFQPDDAANVLAFYRFFSKFGTHFISTVSTGGALYYYYAVSQSSSYSSTEIRISASAEYQGLISHTSAEANAHWANCATNWTSHRQSKAVVVPATAAVIDWVNPAAGTYDPPDGTSGPKSNFSAWKDAVTANPSRCKFSLTPIWALFSGAKWQALQQAFAAYGNNRISVLARKNGAAVIMVNGKPIMPPGGYPVGNVQSWQIVTLDRKSLAVQLNKIYQFNFNAPNWPDSTFDAMASDLEPYMGSTESILITATSNIDEACNPNTTVYAIFKSFGAGAALDQWMSEPNHGCSSGPNSAVYALVGAGGSADGSEGFGGTYPGVPTAAQVTISTLLLPFSGSFTPMSYES
jgi:hypothetical protein